MQMRLRLFHTTTGVRVAYREQGTGPTLVLVHSIGLSHREFEPLAAGLDHRYRLVLCDLPAHGDSEDRSDNPYTFDWLAEVLAAFCRDVGGPRPFVGGHGLGADLLLRAIELRLLKPSRLIVMPCDLHRRPDRPLAAARRRRAAAALALARFGARTSAATILRTTALPPDLQTQAQSPGVSALLNHATADLALSRRRLQAWARTATSLPTEPRRSVLDLLPQIDCPVMLLWASDDRRHPLCVAEEALDLLPHGLLRVLPGTGYLIAYDDPVGVTRELLAFGT